ncbi:MAG: stage III sporulation protein AB [Lachnospiraceae bacterium]
MLLKVSGVVFIMAATTFMGIRRADDIQEEYRQMRYLQRIVSMMESEIRYARSHMGEIFSHIASHAQEPYKGWLLSMQREMNCANGKTFDEIWCQAIKGYLKDSGLPQNELARLMQLGNQLGVVDLKYQMNILELFQQQLSLNMEEMREGMKTKVRLCRCLGVMSGMLISILLV